MHAHSHTLRLEPKRALCCPSSALFFLQVYILLLLCVSSCKHARARTSCLLCSHSRACTLLDLHIHAPAHPHDCPLFCSACTLLPLCIIIVRSGCFSLPLCARNSPLTCPRASCLPHFFICVMHRRLPFAAEASFVGLLVCLCIRAHACVCVCPYCNVGDTVGACSRCCTQTGDGIVRVSVPCHKLW